MAFYSPQEKKDFILKDMKNAIGMGVGNAFTKAVDYHLGMINNLPIDIKKEIKDEDMLESIMKTRDEFFSASQQKIHEEFNNWLKQNEDEIDESLGISNNNPKPL